MKNSAGLALLEESVRTYVLCSHVLLPSQAMILSRLAYLMSTPNREWSLVALLSALCHQDYVKIFLYLFHLIRKIFSLFPHEKMKWRKYINYAGNFEDLCRLSVLSFASKMFIYLIKNDNWFCRYFQSFYGQIKISNPICSANYRKKWMKKCLKLL